MRDPQLNFFAQDNTKDVTWLEDLLRERPRWVTAAQILELIGRENNESGKRLIRDLANASRWVISGQRGYKHLKHSTPEEIHHFYSWMIAQARSMAKRAIALRRNAHTIFG